MRKWSQFRISTLMGLATVIAVGCVLTQPFNPRVEFRGKITASHGNVTGDDRPSSTLTMINKGVLPFWFEGNGHIDSFFLIEDENTIRHLRGERGKFKHSHKTWTAVWPGESIKIKFPTPSECKTAVVRIELADWRGRSTYCSTEGIDLLSATTWVNRGRLNWTPIVGFD